MSNLAGRGMSVVDLNIYNQQFHEWVQFARERNTFHILLKYGLTYKKFHFLKYKFCKSNNNVKNLDDEWRAFFNSAEYKTSINNIINPYKKN
jgi:hypothetical protein